MNTSIATPASPLQGGAEILERILAARGNLIALEGGDKVGLVGLLRPLVRRSGQAVYLWNPELGLGNLREEHVGLPGSQRLNIALRYMLQSNHFGIYLLQRLPLPLPMADATLLRQLARATSGHVRRVVMLDPPESFVASFNDVLVRLSCQSEPAQRPRLRDGRWIL
ncbi:hypothetical protein [Dyella japonica]|jgi:hypothetical protein|uniref:Uncharacterized protein n=1 Tax=Dyella japonica DSM 16301 TaxID=1440762 RepID=A0A0G9H1X4_9GAMM|nr:hypothetical protein [Dyella japonica]KLD63840.1 hypothetical protein Y882_09450 [Dyella japonica DSM 16301]